MFKLIKLKQPVTLNEQQKDESYSDVTYEYSIVDSNEVFKPHPCHSDYDILTHNTDYLMSQLKWKRKHSMPSSVSFDGNQFDVNSKDALREKCESKLYSDGRKFSFKCVTGLVQLTQSDAQEIRDEIERQTHGRY